MLKNVIIFTALKSNLPKSHNIVSAEDLKTIFFLTDWNHHLNINILIDYGTN